MAGTEVQIKEAAKKVFVEKGFAGARMQEIADEAGINKAMLHYYYRSKDRLFEVIFNEALDSFLPKFKSLLAADVAVEDKIRNFIEHYIREIKDHPEIPLFILHELNQHSDGLGRRLGSHKDFPDIRIFLSQIAEEIGAGKIRSVHPFHLVVNIISLCVFPFMGKPMLQTVGKMDEAVYDAFIDERVGQVTSFVLHALRPE